MGGIGVITNPRSRQNRNNPRLAHQLGYILGEKGDLQQPPDLDALAATARAFRDRNIDIVCINGGDGTMHRVLSAMVHAYQNQPLPKIAILRGGTMNTVAHGLKIKGSPSEILDWVVQRYHSDLPFPTARRWLMEVDRENFGFLFGNGLIAKYLELYYEGSEPTPTKAAWLLIRAALSAVIKGSFIRRLFEPYDGKVLVDGRCWEPSQYLMVAAGSVDDIGFGFRPFWRSLLHPQAFHVIGTSSLSPLSIVRELWNFYRAKPIEGEEWSDQVGRELILRSERPITYMLDGDFHRGGTELRIRIGPPVDFVLPGRD